MEGHGGIPLGIDKHVCHISNITQIEVIRQPFTGDLVSVFMQVPNWDTSLAKLRTLRPNLKLE